ncbi:MAG: hypothetical protein HZB25_05560 [Candidatus Eisenbacteria bacterium]|nr:hypothetical protein [Candidatus Eisenbacteria bacterium]
MKYVTVGIAALCAISLLTPALVAAAPVTGTYSSPSRGGNVLVGRASTSRQFMNSGNPKVFNGQSWSGSTLGTQWVITCGVEVTSVPPDSSLFNPVTQTGTITYHQTFNGGTFTLFTAPSVGWGSGSGTLQTTQAVSQVFLSGGIPMGSSFTAVTTGTFSGGCLLRFAMANGFGVGETPYFTKPATYPAFLNATCGLADASHQFGTWGDVNDILVNIDCTTPIVPTTWGKIRTIFR